MIINKKTIPNIVCILILLLLFLQYTEYGSNTINYLIIGFAAVIWLAVVTMGIDIKELFLILVVAFVDLIQIAVFQSGSFQTILMFLPLAIYFIKREKLWKPPYFIVAAIIVLVTLISWINSPNNYLLFDSMSRNYVSVFAIYALTLINLCYEKENKDCPFIYFVIVWIICLSAFGRGGILASSIMVILEYAYKMFKKEMSNSKRNRTFILICLAIIFVIYVYLNFDWISDTILRRFFGGESSAVESNADRLYMIKKYIDECLSSFSSLLFGANAFEISLVGNNMHNSYIQVHSAFGLIGLIFVIIMSIKGVFYLVKSNRETSAILFIGVLIRAFTDWCFPGFPLEFILWYYMLLPILENRKSILRSNNY